MALDTVGVFLSVVILRPSEAGGEGEGTLPRSCLPGVGAGLGAPGAGAAVGGGGVSAPAVHAPQDISTLHGKVPA